MTISLDGLEEDHNWMRGNNQSFQMVSQAIDMLVATEGFVFDIVTCVNRRNYPKLDDIKDYRNRTPRSAGDSGQSYSDRAFCPSQIPDHRKKRGGAAQRRRLG